MSDIARALRGSGDCDPGCNCLLCEAADEIDRLRAEVERLKRELHHHREGDDQDGLHIITDEQIDRAWELGGKVLDINVLAYGQSVGSREALAELGIVECPECGGSGRRIDLPDRACKGCHGHGWTREEHGDE